MGIAVGIDLGTTNSAIARIDEYERPVVIPNDLGDPITPSVICFRDGEIVVGKEAKELQRAGEPDVAAFFKRQMGVPNFTFFADDREYSAVDLSALLLRKLKADAEAVLGESVTDAVITVPAYFRNPQREDTIEAGKRAGLNVLQIINEPTAAAKAYGVTGLAVDKTLMVYDLGGGTFDVTLLRLSSEELRIISSEGDSELGGKDWDDCIIEYLLTRFKTEFGRDPFEDMASVSDLLVRAEEAKKKLSAATTAPVTIRSGECVGRYELNRAKLEEITNHLMERTCSLCRRVLELQNMTPAQVDGVLLVGGSTRMAVVKKFIEETFGKSPMGGVNVDEAVALGAAITAHERTQQASSAGKTFRLGGRVRTVDVTNHSLGMIAVSAEGDKYMNSAILPKDRPIPCEETRPFRVRARRAGQTEIYMTQGESDSPLDVTYLGKYVVKDIPADASGVTILDVAYSYSSSATVEVRAKVQGSSEWLRVDVEPLPADVPDRFTRPPKEETVEPATVYLTFDLSGSMSGSPLTEAKNAASKFLENIDVTQCAVGIAAVADSVRIVQPACNDARAVERAIASLHIGMVGGGNDAHPFDELLAHLKGVKGNRFAVVLADGVWADQALAIRRAKACHSEGIEIIAIGFGGADKRFLSAIASSDENSMFTNLNNLVQTFSTIAQVITETGGSLSMAPGAPGAKKGSLLSRLRGS